MRMRNLLLALLIVCLASTGIMAKTKLVQFTYTYHGQDYLNFMTEAKAKFEKLNPDIEIEFISGGDYTKAITMAAGGVAPDILDMSTNLAMSYYMQGLIQDLSPFIRNDKEIKLQDFVPQSLAGYQARGALFGLPNSIFQILCFYNVDLFLQAGIRNPNELGDKWNWDAVVSSGKKLTIDRNGDGSKDQWGVKAANSFYRWPIFLHQAGALLFDRLVDPTKSTFDTLAGRTGLNFYADIYRAHHIALEVNKMWDAQKLFYAGQIAISLDDGPSLFGILPKEAKDQFEWDIAELPKGPDNNGTYTIMNGWQMSATTAHPAEAWRWIKFLVNRDSSFDYMLKTGRTPARIALLREYSRALTVRPKHLDAASEAVLNPASKPPYLTPIYSDLETISGNVITSVLKGEMSVIEALQRLDVAADALFERLGK